MNSLKEYSVRELIAGLKNELEAGYIRLSKLEILEVIEILLKQQEQER